MFEAVLKLQVPPPRRAALMRLLAGPRASTAHTAHTPYTARLHALYFDTADARLARAGLVLRLSAEDGVWRQGLMRRHGEAWQRGAAHEVVLGGGGAGAPRIDARRHEGTARLAPRCARPWASGTRG